mgnify:CR=1 FL=1
MDFLCFEDGRLEIERYWHLDYEPKLRLDDREAAGELRRLLFLLPGEVRRFLAHLRIHARQQRLDLPGGKRAIGKARAEQFLVPPAVVIEIATQLGLEGREGKPAGARRKLFRYLRELAEAANV